MILGNLFSKKLLSGSYPNFRGILEHFQPIKINFFVTKYSVEMEIHI